MSYTNFPRREWVGIYFFLYELLFYSLVFVSIEKINQTLETVSSAIQHLEFRQNTPLRVVLLTLFSVFGYPNETLSLMFDKLRIYQTYLSIYI